MAKGSAMGLWKGKKGSSVFYQIKNSNSLQKQGIRERNYEPSNPQSANQANQRMRMYPAQAVYGAIKDVIERSWQGIKYGQMSRQEYLKHALREPLFPSVTKGDSVVVPGPYQISKGTLQEVEATVSAGRFTFPIFCGTASFDWDSSLADLSTAIIENNPFLKEGDQLSFVVCNTNLNGNGFYWNVFSFYINTLATDESIGVIFSGKITGTEVKFNGEGISFVSGDHIFMAAACVISREGSTPMRSTARLACDYQAADMQAYYSAEALTAAKRSYMKQLSTLETDWPADPESDAGGDSADTIRITANAYNEFGTVTGGGTYQRGALVSLVATPQQGYVVQGWYTSEQDAEGGTGPISQAAILTFTAGDSSAFGGATTFWVRFILQG